MLQYALQAQVSEVFGSDTCSIIKPLHNLFTDCSCNREYKQGALSPQLSPVHPSKLLTVPVPTFACMCSYVYLFLYLTVPISVCVSEASPTHSAHSARHTELDLGLKARAGRSGARAAGRVGGAGPVTGGHSGDPDGTLEDIVWGAVQAAAGAGAVLDEPLLT